MVQQNGQYIYRGGGGTIPMSCDEAVVVAMHRLGHQQWRVWVAGESGDYYDLRAINAGEEELFECESGHSAIEQILS